jgi:predicted Zn-dependent protease with MMP-like domain
MGYMLEISDEQFSAMIAEVMDELPHAHMDAVKNVAIVYADEPTPDQRQKLQLRHDQSLFGLYEGVPLTRRQGMTGYPPDKITIFKGPMLQYVYTLDQLRAQVKHTLWHEIAHYFGLDHPAIHALENKPRLQPEG